MNLYFIFVGQKPTRSLYPKSRFTRGWLRETGETSLASSPNFCFPYRECPPPSEVELMGPWSRAGLYRKQLPTPLTFLQHLSYQLGHLPHRKHRDTSASLAQAWPPQEKREQNYSVRSGTRA